MTFKGKHHNEETKRKISKGIKLNYKIYGSHNKGKKYPPKKEETKRKLSEYNKNIGKWRGEDNPWFGSNRFEENNPNYGKKHLHLSEKMRINNPMNNPESRKKIVASKVNLEKGKHSKEFERIHSKETINFLEDLAERQQIFPIYHIKDYCEACNSKDRLVVHHISYNPPECSTLCILCHFYLHIGLLKGKKVRPENGWNYQDGVGT